MSPRRRTIRAALAVSLVVASGIVASTMDVAADASIQADVAPSIIATVPSLPSGADPWLDTINWWRSFGGAVDGTPLAAVSSAAGDADGPQHQVDYLAGIHAQGSTYCGHDSDPSFPRTAGLNYSHNVLMCGSGTISAAVDDWMNTPFHAPPLLSPATSRVGAAITSNGEFSAAAAVAAAAVPIDRVYTWPKNGGAMPRTTMAIAESPDPTTLCPTGAVPAQPAFAWFPTSRVLRSASVRDAAGDVPFCLLDDGSGGPVVVAPGSSFTDAAVFSLRPFTPGSAVTISIGTSDATGADPQTLAWTFTPVSVPAMVQASFRGHDGGATVTVPAPTAADLGGAAILERQLLLWDAAGGVTGSPTWRLPVSTAGSNEVVIPGGDYWACVVARNVVGWSSCSTFVRVGVTGTAAATSRSSSGFQAVDPVRLVDTRVAGAPFSRLHGGSTYVLDVRGIMPSDADAIALNIAAVDAGGAGWVRAYPCTAAVPATSSVNPEAGVAATTSAAVVKVGDGRLCFQSMADVDLVVDLNGWLTRSSTAGLSVDSTRRLLDTRLTGQLSSRLGAGSTVALPVVASGSTTTAVSLSVTAVDPGADGYITVWPCGSPRPFVANLTPSAGVTRPNLVNVRVGEGGQVCVYSSLPTDLVVDLMGEYRPGAAARFSAIDPLRLLDTRNSSPVRSADGAAMVESGTVVALQGTLTAVSPSAAGYQSAYACATEAWPGTANVTFRAGQTSGNAVLMGASNGYTCVRDPTASAFVVDVTGVWKTP